MKKGKFFILKTETNKGKVVPKAEERDGYIDTIKGIKIGFHANRDDKNKVLNWTATELTTGFGVGTGKTRKAAAEFVNNNIDYLKAKLKDAGLDKYKDVIKKANAKLDKLPEFTELPTKAEPPKVAEKCYTKTDQPKAKGKGKFDLYAEVTDRIVKQLEEGNIPWHKPWTGGINGAFNRVSKKPYSILNQCLLKHTGEYASYKQWTELGGRPRKGTGEIVVFWKIYKKEKVDENGEKKVTSIPLLRYINVFHISNVDGVEPLKDGLKATESIPEADVVIADYVEREGITFKEVYEDKAFYRPSADYVQVPCKDQFNGNANEYYATAFHELVHSTGHPKRLNRITQVAAFGDEEYSKEELVAEIGSAGIMNYLGLETGKTFKNSAAYIQSWIKALKDDTHMIVNASSKADKAMNLILGK